MCTKISLSRRYVAKSMKNPSSSSKLFFTDKMMDNFVQYRNKNMQSVIDKLSDPLDGLSKYSHVKLVGRVDIDALIGILYLGTAFWTEYL